MAAELEIVGNPTGIGQRNRVALLRALAGEGPMARNELAQRLRLTEAAVSRITRDLIRAGFLEETEAVAPTGRPGRPGVNLRIRAEGGYVVGIGINAYEQSALLVGLDGMRIAETPIGRTGMAGHEEDANRIAARITAIVRETGIDRARLLGVGIACAGAIDPVSGIVVASPTIGWRNMPARRLIGDRLGLPCAVEGTANAILKAEFQAGLIGRDRDAFAINVALGFGGGMMVNGDLLRGRNFLGGQISRVRTPDGSRTLDEACAGRGVLARLGESLSARGGETYDPAYATARLLEIIARADEPRIADAFRAAGEEAGRSLAALVTALSPGVILAGGPVARVEAWLDGFCRGVAGLLPPGEPAPEIRLTTMSNTEAGAHLALGASFLDNGLETARLSAFQASA